MSAILATVDTTLLWQRLIGPMGWLVLLIAIILIAAIVFRPRVKHEDDNTFSLDRLQTLLQTGQITRDEYDALRKQALAQMGVKAKPKSEPTPKSPPSDRPAK